MFWSRFESQMPKERTLTAVIVINIYYIPQHGVHLQEVLKQNCKIVTVKKSEWGK